MEKQLPKTKEECFAQLDAILSDEDKKVLRESEDVVIFHFSLGSWIRNNWLYPLSDENVQSFMKMFADEEEVLDGLFFFDADSVSSNIIDEYMEYLKNGMAK